MAFIWLVVSVFLLPTVADAQALEGGCWLSKDDFPVPPTSPPDWMYKIDEQCYTVFPGADESAEKAACRNLASLAVTIFIEEINAQNFASMTNRLRSAMKTYLGNPQNNANRNLVLFGIIFRPNNGNLLQFTNCVQAKGDCNAVNVIFALNSQSVPIVGAEMRIACNAKWKDAELEACRDCVDAIESEIFSSNAILVQRKAVSKRLQRYSESGKNANRTDFLKATEISGWGSLWQIYACDAVVGDCSAISEIYKVKEGDRSFLVAGMEEGCNLVFTPAGSDEHRDCFLCADEINAVAEGATRTAEVIAILNTYTNNGQNANRKKFLEDTTVGTWGKISDILTCVTVSGNCSLSKADFNTTTSAPDWMYSIDTSCYATFDTDAELEERNECRKFASSVMTIFVEEMNTENYAGMTDRLRALMKDYISTNKEARSALLRGITFREGTGITVRTLLDFTNCVNAYGDCAYIFRIFQLDAFLGVPVCIEMRKACQNAWKSSASELEACNDCADAIEMDVSSNQNSLAAQTSATRARLIRYRGGITPIPDRVKFLTDTDIIGWGTLLSITQCQG